MNKRTFQLYLLSRMRAETRVTAALAALGATRADLPGAVAEAVAFGLETPGHRAALYSDILGAPVREVQDAAREVPFAGSTRLAFDFEIFPGVELGVGRHPEGWAFDVGFDRRRGMAVPHLASSADLAAWMFVKAEISARFGTPTTEDAWSGWEDLSYRIPPEEGASPMMMLLRFDVGLLQSAEVLIAKDGHLP